MSEKEIESLTDDELDALLRNPHFSQLPNYLHQLAMRQRPEGPCTRTYLLTWLYQDKGSMTFDELAQLVSGFENITLAKKELRHRLRYMVDQGLVEVVNFSEPERGISAEDLNDQIGQTSIVSMSLLGAVWLRRAWDARFAMDKNNPMHAHQVLTEEEVETPFGDLMWIESLVRSGTVGDFTRTRRRALDVASMANIPVSSIFSLADQIRKEARHR